MTIKISNIRHLVDIVSDNVDILEGIFKAQDVDYPTLDTIYDANSISEKLLFQPQVLDTALIAVSAASQLIATLKLPIPLLFERATGYHISSALRVASTACVVEILREAGPQGMHVRDIAGRTNLETSTIGRCLRLLATHYIFKEVQPDVFANNRLSSVLDTGKNSEALVSLTRKTMEDPSTEYGVSVVHKEKYEDTNGVAAFIDIATDYNNKSSAFIPDVFLENHMGQYKLPFQAAHQFSGTFWDFLESHPGHMSRFQKAMEGLALMQSIPSSRNADEDQTGFDWSNLPASSIVVDVGGGNGSVSFSIAKREPHLKIVIQDRQQTIQDITIPSWERDYEKKQMLKSGQVKIEAQNFFSPQPSHIAKKADVFFMEHILHDWPSSDCAKILHQLHDAAAPSTKLIIVDIVVPYACHEFGNKGLFEGSSLPAVPPILLGNLGEANTLAYCSDMIMKGLFNGQERTFGEFKRLAEETGWKIEKIYQMRGSSLSQILCSKVL